MIDQMNGPALVRAYNGLAAIRHIEPVKRFSDAKSGRLRVTASLEIVRESHEVQLAEDGTVTSNQRTQLAGGQDVGLAPPLPPESETPAPSQPVKEPSRVSPGLARLRAHLGDEGTEALRNQVLGDSDKSLVEAAKREVVMDPHERDAAAASSLPARSPDITSVAPPQSSQAVPQLADQPRPPVEDNQPKTDEQPPAPPVSAAKPATAAPVRKAAGRTPSVSDSDLILVKVDAGYNPKRGTAGDRFGKYVHRMSVAEYTAAIGGDKKQALRDLAWDVKQGWVEVVGASHGQ